LEDEVVGDIALASGSAARAPPTSPPIEDLSSNEGGNDWKSPRLKDLADVIELIKNLRLPAEFRDQLNPYVRDQYDTLWRSVRESEALQEE
jgi:hypothetical protein